MPERRPSRPRADRTRRSVLIGLSAGAGGVAGWVLTSVLGSDDDDEVARDPNPDSVGPRPYTPPEGAVPVLEPRRYYYDEPGDTDGQTFGDLYLPDSANPALPVVVLIHGGGWKDSLGLAYMENQARDLASFDVAVWNIEYRRVDSGGGWPTTVADVCGAVDHLAEISGRLDGRLDLDRVVVSGHSAGGHLALWVAGRARLPSSLPGARPVVPVAGCVSLAGVADLLDAERAGDRYVAELLGGRSRERRQRYVDASPVTHLPTGIPVVCVHGRQDKVVRPEQSEAYVRAARRVGDPARVSLVPGGHDPWGDITGDVWHDTRRTLLAMARRSPNPAG
ncbi:alpha/beta hydrolase [Dietzia sp. PP-33]|jgi:acetyl esterase/lipase|uniref:alpha/beta hydrolase n=1 Tax=Dietzia sp. PP-33 TaxID=2957500 RepID=UPI0029B141A8|nr:alpha/beta hydrolase [Dietzia sp. PP-33]MDX2356341.1 alpha/beta hydrolase [Dietzia sp. PP-33]